MPSSPSMIPEQITAIEDAPPRQIEEMTRAFVKLFTSVGSLVWEWAWCELIEQAGWLPHASIPPELIADAKDVADAGRSEERRVGKECVSTWRSRWSPYAYKKKQKGKPNYEKQKN